MTFPLTTTLNRIHACRPCADGWRRGLAALGKTQGDDEPLSFAELVDLLELDDVLWCCRSAPEYDAHWRRFTLWCAREVQDQLTDPRSLQALDVAERHAAGAASDDELAAARAAAEAAARQRQAVAFRQLVTDGTLPLQGGEGEE